MNRCSDELMELMDLMRVVEVLSPYWALLGMHVDSVGRDCAVGHIDIENKHLQILGTVHGGVHAALADAMAWVAILGHYYPDYVHAVTINLTTRYLKPISKGRLYAAAKLIHVREPLATINVELSNENNELIATATTTYWVTKTNKTIHEHLGEIRIREQR
jgi:uncharacterized protein (TIGR00369 family)